MKIGFIGVDDTIISTIQKKFKNQLFEEINIDSVNRTILPTFNVILVDFENTLNFTNVCNDISKLNYETKIIVFISQQNAISLEEQPQNILYDYVTKPFLLNEFEAKIQRIVNDNFRSSEIQIKKDVKYIPTKRELYIKGKYLHLTHKEAELLDLLIKNNGYIVDKNFLMYRIWGKINYTYGLYALIVKLKEKLPAGLFSITASKGRGYILKVLKKSQN